MRVAANPDTAWSKGIVQWHLNAALFGTENDEYESRNILWTTPMPDDGPGVGSPILVGDKLLVSRRGLRAGLRFRRRRQGALGPVEHLCRRGHQRRTAETRRSSPKPTS